MAVDAAAAAPPRDLRPLFDPRSIAVVGASSNAAKWGYWLTKGALRGAGRRAVHLVNPSGQPVLGHPTVASLAELEEAPELVVSAVPSAAFDATVEAALECGARGIIAINAGFAELGPGGRERQEKLAARVRAAGAMLVGPNCLGLMDSGTELEAAWLPVGRAGLAPGPLTVVAQSGNLGLDLTVHARERGIGVARFISIGNQGDVSLAEFMHDLASHEETKLIALYCEDVGDGRALFAAAERAVAAGKQVLVIAAGGSEASSRAARSHTGSLTSAADVVAAACRDSGAIHVPTPEQLLDVAQLLLRQPPRGRRLALLSDGGGHAVFGADVATAAGLEVHPFSEALSARLAESIPSAPATGNPVDLGGAIEPTHFERAIEILTAAEEVDGVIVAGGYGQWPELDAEIGREETASAGRIASGAEAAGKCVAVQTFFTETESALALRDGGVPVFRSVGVAVEAYARAVAASEVVPAGIPPLPAATASARPTDDAASGYFAARELLAAAGLAFPAARAVASAEEAAVAASELGFPVALKATGLLHKSDSGGVALGLADADAVRATFAVMAAKGLPGPYAVEAMAATAAGVELLVGCRRDPRFGPVLLVGLGGVYAELLAEKALALAPTEPATVERLLGQLRGGKLLSGLRGRPAIDLGAAAAAAAAVSRVAAENPWIEAIEVNPLLARADGAIALDARLLPVSD